jgi:hypothetical protein
MRRSRGSEPPHRARDRERDHARRLRPSEPRTARRAAIEPSATSHAEGPPDCRRQCAELILADEGIRQPRSGPISSGIRPDTNSSGTSASPRAPRPKRSRSSAPQTSVAGDHIPAAPDSQRARNRSWSRDPFPSWAKPPRRNDRAFHQPNHRRSVSAADPVHAQRLTPLTRLSANL